MTKYIFVTGGVILIVKALSLMVLYSKCLDVLILIKLKLDPYLNIDPGAITYTTW